MTQDEAMLQTVWCKKKLKTAELNGFWFVVVVVVVVVAAAAAVVVVVAAGVFFSFFSFFFFFVGCLTSQQRASVSQGPICSDNFTCCQTEIEIADQTCYLTQSQYADRGPTSPIADPKAPGG